MATTEFAYAVKSILSMKLLKEHDGGGHPLASGANSYSLEGKRNHLPKVKNLLKTDKILAKLFRI